jgi:SnoaL-like domain
MTQLTHGDAEDLLATWKRGWETRNPDLIVELFDRDADYRPGPFVEPFTGTNAIRAHWNEIVAAQAHIDFDAEHTWVSGSAVLTSWHAAYTVRRTGERIRVYGFMTFELGDNGRVRRFRQWPVERVVGRDAKFQPEGGDE